MVKEVGDVQEPPSFPLKLEKPRSAQPKAASGGRNAPVLPERRAAPSPSADQAERPVAAEPPQLADHSAKAPATPSGEVQTPGAQPLAARPQAAIATADKGKAPAVAMSPLVEAFASPAPQQVLSSPPAAFCLICTSDWAMAARSIWRHAMMCVGILIWLISCM